MSSRTFTQRRWLPLLLIGIGVVWLLGTLGVFSGASVRILLTYWPLLLIGFGLDYLLGRNRELDVSYSVLAVGVLVLLMLVGPLVGMGRGPQATEEQFREPLGDTKRVDVNLNIDVVPVEVRPLGEDDLLFSADIRDPGQVDLRVRGGNRKTIDLERAGRLGSFSDTDARWQLALTPEIPVSLDVDGGSAPATLDLSALQLAGFDIDAEAGPIDLTLPETPDPYRGEIEMGAGSLDITVAEGARFELDIDAGNGSLSLDLERDVALDLSLDAESGSVDIRFASGSAVRLEIDDDGPGMVSVGGGLEHVRGSGDTGVWQTPGFGDAERQIVIEIDDVGAGPISVR
ncbi:MAG: DUF5668 domain-containing protein [Trueperaceae bacterium]|nr:DUF5668 domain-containing protein [Trueperaceae bacterium]